MTPSDGPDCALSKKTPLQVSHTKTVEVRLEVNVLFTLIWPEIDHNSSNIDASSVWLVPLDSPGLGLHFEYPFDGVKPLLLDFR